MSSIPVQRIDHNLAEIDDDLLSKLSEALRGRIVVRRHESFEKARAVWNGLIDKKPGLIIQCAGIADIIAGVRFASEHQLRIHVRGGGHNVAGACMADDELTLDLSGMRSVYVDPVRQTARVEGGARLGDLDHETQAFGLAAPVGVVSATGVAGLTLHGGVGWLLRKHGLSIDNLLSVDVVSADGKLRRADRERNADLFWAVRGGGGNFGVVAAFEFQLHPVGPEVWMSIPIYPAESAAEVMRRFREHMQEAPDELMAIAVYWSAPEDPEIAEQHHGAPVIFLLGCYTGPFEKGEAAIAPLREIGSPLADLSGPMQWKSVQRLLDADYPDGDFYYWKSIFLDRLDDEVLQTLSEYHSARPSAISSIDVWTLGGAMARVPGADTAFYKRDAPYMIGIEANWRDKSENEANMAWARELHQALRRSTSGGDYLNFPGFFEEKDKMLLGAYASNLTRLKSIKAKYDPMNLFAGAVNIPPE